jgi:Flp pilus assembly protein TadG
MEGRADDAGSAVVGFVLVAVLVTAMFLGVVQVAVALHVRSTLVDCAAEGARLAARSDRSLGDGEQRGRDLITQSLSSGYAGQVSARYTQAADARLVEVTVTAPVPVIGLWGPSSLLTVEGHALVEEIL